jgi:hypothetical protein
MSESERDSAIMRGRCEGEMRELGSRRAELIRFGEGVAKRLVLDRVMWFSAVTRRCDKRQMAVIIVLLVV